MSDKPEPENTESVISEDEVVAFAAKLEAWSNQLPEKEQQLLHMMLTAPAAAVAEDSEVQAFDANLYKYQLQTNQWSVVRSWSLNPKAEAYIKDEFPVKGWVNSPRHIGDIGNIVKF